MKTFRAFLTQILNIFIYLLSLYIYFVFKLFVEDIFVDFRCVVGFFNLNVEKGLIL